MRHQEMSLLIIFDAIMTEGSITLAADRLELTQPAVSNALSRMRQAWNDELFIKDGRTIQPTLYAQNLWQQIKVPLNDLAEAINVEDFDPGASNRTFRVSASDTIIGTAWGPLRKIIEQYAPNVSVHAIPFTINNAGHLLHHAEVDLVIGGDLDVCETVLSEFLYSPCYSCVMRKDHPLLDGELTLEKFAAADHLLVSLSGNASGFTDEILSQHGLHRKVAMTVNHFSAVPKLLQESDLIAIVPSTTVEGAIFSGELAVLEAPIQIPPNHVNCYWHQRQSHDKGLTWLRENISSIIKDHAAAHLAELKTRICKQCSD